MEHNGSSLQYSALEESLLEESSMEVSTDESELDKEVVETQNQTESILYVSAAEPVYYDTGQMVEISCAGLLVGCGISFFASIARLGINSVKNTFLCLTGTGEEV